MSQLNPKSFSFISKDSERIGDYKIRLPVQINKITYKVKSVYVRTQIRFNWLFYSSIYRKDSYFLIWHKWNKIDSCKIEPKNINYLIERLGQFQLKNYINRLAFLNLEKFARIHTIEEIDTKVEYHYDELGSIAIQTPVENVEPVHTLSLIVENVLDENQTLRFLNWKTNEDLNNQNNFLLDGLRWSVISKTIDKLAKKLKVNVSNDAFLYKTDKLKAF